MVYNQVEPNVKSKFIPVSMESLEDCHYAAGKDLYVCILIIMRIPNYSLVSLRLGGSKELYKENGTAYGDLSAILITTCLSGLNLAVPRK